MIATRETEITTTYSVWRYWPTHGWVRNFGGAPLNEAQAFEARSLEHNPRMPHLILPDGEAPAKR